MAERDVRTLNANKIAFDLLVDDVPYLVTAEPFNFNGEKRFNIDVNGSEHVFTWDAQLHRLRGIDDDAGVLPDALEEAINEKLYQYLL